MKRDPLAVLWRLRDAAVTETSRNLATARALERQETERLAAFRETIRTERLQATDGQVPAFAAWLPHARLEDDRLQAGLLTQEALVRRLQQVLVNRRTEAEAVSTARQQRLAQAKVLMAKKDQDLMDEAAGRTGQRHIG